MSEPQTDWDGPKIPQPAQEAPPAGESAKPAAEGANLEFSVESPEFALGATSEPSDDSPTIISRTIRKPGQVDHALSTSLRGKHLAHFELLEAIGVGGMAAVIRAHDQQLDRLVALKILPPAMSSDQESLRRFQHEARAAARLDHENIARVFYCGEDQGLHFIAFEFVEGDNLRTILDRRKQIPVPEAIKYMLQVAAGLAHASSRGVVHRDIKPSNIIITPTGRAKLVDMGLARSLGPQGDGALTQSGVTLGTFDYISPEQALEPRDADVRSDIYSLGCTFYHMLTGLPPVPEGTAAKKLHHHQHVAPVDPRQLNPSVPDDVAAVLGRMMAKDAKNRYQRPEHLVQHLLQLAHKMGASADVPEGVLFVDAPLPNPPRSRPLLVGGIAAAVLVAVIALLGSLPTTTKTPELRSLDPLAGPTEPQPSKVGEKVNPGSTAKITQVPDNPPPTGPAAPRRVFAQTSKDLAEAVKFAAVHIALPEKQFDLKLKREDGGDVPGIVFQGKELVIQADDPAKRPTLFLGYTFTDSSSKDQPWAGLTVTGKGSQVTLKNLRFKIDATGTSTPMAAVLRSAGRVVFENCEFVQSGFPSERAEMRSVEVAGVANEGNDGRPDMVFDRCYFRGGHEALLFTGMANVQLKDCAFAPHDALFHFRGAKVEDAELRLDHCSAMLGGNASAFLLSDEAGARLLVNNCLFSNPGGAAPEGESGLVLVRQIGESSGRLRYVSDSRNVYHNLGAFWMQGARIRSPLLEDFRLNAGIGRNDRSVALAVNPWQLDKPLAMLSAPEKAFQASQDLPELRTVDHPDTRMVGVETCVWGSLYPATLRALKEKIVDITVKESGHGVYPSLGQAIGEAKPGDTILIKTNETIAVAPLRLEDSLESLDLTIKPFQGYHPILKLGPTTDMDAALFRIRDGKLNLENLEFKMPPPLPLATGQSLVFISGDGQCTFKRCMLTLQDRAAKEVNRSVITLPDPSTVMRKDPKGTLLAPPRLRFDGCFIRGEGELVSVRASQAFSLEVEDSLAVFDGSLVVINGSNSREPPANPPVQITLNKVTTYLSEPLLTLKGGETKAGLVPTHADVVVNCIFASGRDKSAFVHLEGMDNDQQAKRLFSWGEGKDNVASKQNVYSGFSPMLDQRPRDSGMMLTSKWEEFTRREEKPRFDKVTFAGWPAGEKPFSKALPGFFRVKSPDLLGSGADVDRLPRPAGEVEPDPPAPAAPED